LKTKLHKIKITIKAGFQQDTKGTRPLACAQNKQFHNHYNKHKNKQGTFSNEFG